LRVEELAEVLAIDFDAAAHGGIPQFNPNWRWADHHQAVLSTCSSLIAIVDDGDSKVVQFSHYSVKEFLTSDRLGRSSGDISRYHILLEPAHTILAQACLGVLVRVRLVDPEWVTNFDDEIGIPLVKYAARHWVDHAQFKNVASLIRDAMVYFFDADRQHWASWGWIQQIDEEWQYFGSGLAVHGSPLYYASLGGFYDLAEHLVVKHPEQINARSGLMQTPLVAALAGEHFELAELLYRHGAEVDVRDNTGSTPLCVVCAPEESEDPDMVRWLLNHGADVNSRTNGPHILDTQADGPFSPLHLAVMNQRCQAFQILLEHNADIHFRDRFGATPLHRAASPLYDRDHIDLMQSLLDHGADPNARDGGGSTPLHYSSWCKKGRKESEGTVEGTRLLLKHGAIMDIEDNEGRTPLQLALEHGRQDIVTCLSEHGATR
jgi:ankyrin repeat protein